MDSYFLLGKIVGFLLTPSSVIITAILLGAALQVAARFRVEARLKLTAERIAIVGLIALAIGAATPLGPMLQRSLEGQYPPLRLPVESKIDGIILLGGGIRTVTVAAHVHQTLGDSAERVRYAAQLARQFPEVPIYLAGGRVFPRAGARSEADVTADYLTDLGIARARLRLDGASRNTIENAHMIAALIRDHEIGNANEARCFLVVTSAFHMKRAIATFEAAGLPVEAAPTDWRSDETQPFLLGSPIGNLSALDLSAHEYLGLLALLGSKRAPTLRSSCPSKR